MKQKDYVEPAMKVVEFQHKSGLLIQGSPEEPPKRGGHRQDYTPEEW